MAMGVLYPFFLVFSEARRCNRRKVASSAFAKNEGAETSLSGAAVSEKIEHPSDDAARAKALCIVRTPTSITVP